MSRPLPADYPPYFGKYIGKVDAPDITQALGTYSRALNEFYAGLPDSKADFKYAPDKWTVKDLLQHLIDTERIMAYRLLCIARKDKTALPSFDENAYAVAAAASQRSFDSIKEDLLAQRKASDLLIQSLTEEQLAEDGIASGQRTTANAVAFIIFGHLLHHKQVLEERYL